jgi:transketolase
MRILPNMAVLAPADGPETRAMVRWAVTYEGPVYIRTSRIPFPVIHDEDYTFELGRSHILREGDDVTLAGMGLMVHHCLAAADLLAQQGVRARVLNLSSLKPLDWELVVDSARRTGCVVTAEEHLATGGLGSAVSEVLAEFRPTPLVRVGIRDTFGLSGKPDELLKHFGLTPEHITKAAQKVMARKKGA